MKILLIPLALFLILLATTKESSNSPSDYFELELVFEKPQPTYQWVKDNIFKDSGMRFEPPSEVHKR